VEEIPIKETERSCGLWKAWHFWLLVSFFSFFLFLFSVSSSCLFGFVAAACFCILFFFVMLLAREGLFDTYFPFFVLAGEIRETAGLYHIKEGQTKKRAWLMGGFSRLIDVEKAHCKLHSRFSIRFSFSFFFFLFPFSFAPRLEFYTCLCMAWDNGEKGFLLKRIFLLFMLCFLLLGIFLVVLGYLFAQLNDFFHS
jgi:hypothetical protein